MVLRTVPAGISVLDRILILRIRGLSVAKDEAERAKPISTVVQMAKSIKLYR